MAQAHNNIVCNNIYALLFSCKSKKEAISAYLRYFYSFSMDDLRAFLCLLARGERAEAIKIGIADASGKIKPSNKVFDIIGFLTVEVYQKKLRFDEKKAYGGLNVEYVLQDVEQYILQCMEKEGIVWK